MIEIKDTAVSFNTVYNSDYAPRDEKFKSANCLILPYKNFREGVDYCFSEYAQEVLQYSKDNPIDGINMDIAATDENYKVIEMHSILLQIGIFLASSVLLPMTVNLVSNYVYDKIKKLHQKEDDVQVRVTFISVYADGTSKALNYDGPASQFETIASGVKLLANGTSKTDESRKDKESTAIKDN